MILCKTVLHARICKRHGGGGGLISHSVINSSFLIPRKLTVNLNESPAEI